MKALLIVLAALCAVGLLLFVLYLFFIKSNKKRSCDAFRGIRIAHRGLHGPGVPENTLAAFRAARQQGLAVELDVQFTKDRRLVVAHDPDLKRIGGADVLIADLTYAELSDYPLGGTSETVPLFSDVLKLLEDTPIVCELKYYDGQRNTAVCEETCREAAGYRGAFCVESFSPFLIQWFRKNRPDVIRGQLSAAFREKTGPLSPLNRFLMRSLLVNFFSRPDFIAYQIESADAAAYRLCRRLFHPLCIGWTARSAEAERRALLSFDSVIFEQEKPRSL